MYIVDLHLKGETVVSAIDNLYSNIKLARKTKEKVMCLIVGYGSTGGSHKIKTAVLEELKKLKENNQIRGYILGNEVYMFNANYLALKDKDLIDKSLHGRMNEGQIVVIL